MSSVTRHPTGQDLMCLVCLKPAQDIDHVVNRGMGGSKERDVPENKVPLCRECHDLKTVGTIETRIREARFTNRPWALFYEWRRRNSTAPWIAVPVVVSQRYKCLVLSDGAEAGLAGQERQDAPVSPSEQVPVPESDSSAPSPRTKEENDGAESGDGGGGADDDGTRVESLNEAVSLDALPALHGGGADVQRGDSHLVLTHEQRVAIAQEIHDTEWNRQWFAGDTGNLWIEELGESAEQYLSDFGYQPESLANILRVCAAIPPPYRNGNLRFSHHVVVYDQPPEDRMRWLTECEEEQWSVAEFRRQVKGTKKKVKRYSLEELYELGRRFGEEYSYVGPYQKFLDWLEEQQ